MKRKGIGKALRFQIFARDNFTCRYCGRQSDVVPLHIDHVIPVCQDGTNDPENLITACAECNLGKSGKTISQSAPTEADRLRLAQEHNEQLEAARAVQQAAVARAELRQAVCNYYCQARNYHEIKKGTLSVLVSFVQQHGAELVFNWIDIAVARLSPYKSDAVFGKYISGIRRNWLKENGGTP